MPLFSNSRLHLILVLSGLFGTCRFSFAQQTADYCNGNLPLILDTVDQSGHCYEGSWVMIFQDEFEQEELDLKKWVPAKGVLRDPQQLSSQQWNSTENIVISNGVLKLIATEETPSEKCFEVWEESGNVKYCRNFTYHAAEIASRHKFNSGLVEIRCKLPKGKGFFPAFWLYGGGPRGAYSEIDIFEFVNTPRKRDYARVPKFNIHVNAGTAENQIDGNCNVDLFEGVDYSADWHTFSAIWDRFHIEWYIDGKLKHSLYRYYTPEGEPVTCQQLKSSAYYLCNPAFPDDPMAIILDLAILSNQEAPDKRTKFPAAFEIDYVRCYQRTALTSIVSTNQLLDSDQNQGVYQIHEDLNLSGIRNDSLSTILPFEYEIETRTLTIDLATLPGNFKQVELINTQGECVFRHDRFTAPNALITLSSLNPGNFVLLILEANTGKLYWYRISI